MICITLGFSLNSAYGNGIWELGSGIWKKKWAGKFSLRNPLSRIERFHSRGMHARKFMRTKEINYIKRLKQINYLP